MHPVQGLVQVRRGTPRRLPALRRDGSRSGSATPIAASGGSMSIASVPVGISAGATPLTGTVYAGDSGLDLTTVTGVSLKVLDPKGGTSTWTATIPDIPSPWAPSTTYVVDAQIVPRTVPTGLYYECTSRVPATWLANTDYAAGAVVSPPAPTGYVYQCIAAGESGGSAPAWPSAIGGTVTDNGATWICVAVVEQSSPNEPTWPLVVGQSVVDGALVWECIGPVTTPSQLTWSHAWSAGGGHVQYTGAYQIDAQLTIPGGTQPVPRRTLIGVPGLGAAAS